MDGWMVVASNYCPFPTHLVWEERSIPSSHRHLPLWKCYHIFNNSARGKITPDHFSLDINIYIIPTWAWSTWSTWFNLVQSIFFLSNIRLFPLHLVLQTLFILIGSRLASGAGRLKYCLIVGVGVGVVDKIRWIGSREGHAKGKGKGKGKGKAKGNVYQSVDPQFHSTRDLNPRQPRPAQLACRMLGWIYCAPRVRSIRSHARCKTFQQYISGPHEP